MEHSPVPRACQSAESVYESINKFQLSRPPIVFYQPSLERRGLRQQREENVLKEVDKIALRRWRKRGFYSESVLVRLLQKRGCRAVRIPVSNPSLSPLPDIIARKDLEIYAFEVKNASYYAYFPKQQIDKLFRFLNELIPIEKGHKHAVVAAHLGKKWIFKEISWGDWEKDKLPEKVRLLKRDRGNLSFEEVKPTG
jgi:Holliday junction resolvase